MLNPRTLFMTFKNNLKISTPIFLKSTISLNYNKFDNWGTVRSARFNADPSPIGSTEAILDTIFSSSRNRLINDFGISDKKRPKWGLFCSYMTKRDLNGSLLLLYDKKRPKTSYMPLSTGE